MQISLDCGVSIFGHYFHLQNVLQNLQIPQAGGNTDSKYTLGYATYSGEKHHKQNWKKNIPNKDLVKQLYQRISSQPNIQLKHIKAHTNHKDIHSLGNEQAEFEAELLAELMADGSLDKNDDSGYNAYEDAGGSKILDDRENKNYKNFRID